MNILRSLFDFEYKELRKFMKIADQIEAKSDEYEKLTLALNDFSEEQNLKKN